MFRSSRTLVAGDKGSGSGGQPTADCLERFQTASPRYPDGDGEMSCLCFDGFGQGEFALDVITFRLQRTLRQGCHDEIMVQATPSIFARFHLGSQTICQQCCVSLISCPTAGSRGEAHLPMLQIPRTDFQDPGLGCGGGRSILLARLTLCRAGARRGRPFADSCTAS